MSFFVGAPDMVARQVGIYLSGRDVGMSEQLLYGTKVGAAAEKVRRE